jgi:FkbM family methyltransferase
MTDPLNPMLALLRTLTRAGYRVRGAARISEKIREYYIRHPRNLTMKDFDHDLVMHIDLSQHIESQIFWRGAYSSDQLVVVDELLGHEDVFVDIGANVGEFTLFAAKRNRNGRVYSFEPAKINFGRLSSNVTMNGFNHVHLAKVALADNEGEMEIYESRARFTDGSINAGLPSLFGDEGAEPSELVTVTTLDRFVEQQRLERIDLIKVDIEGAELPALRGGARTLQRFRPKLIVEVNQETSRRAGYESRDILAYLRTFGYRFQRIDPRGGLSDCDESAISDFENILCVAGAD